MEKTLRYECANLQEVIAAGLRTNLEEHLVQHKRLPANNDPRGFDKHLKTTVGL